MKASARDVLTAKLYFKAAFPAMNIPLTEDPKQVKKFEKLNVIVQFSAADDAEPLDCYIVFLDENHAQKTLAQKRFKVYQGKYEGFLPYNDKETKQAVRDESLKDDNITLIKLEFKSIKSLLGVFKGNGIGDMLGIVPPLLKNIFKPGILKFLFLMLSLTKTMPSFNPGVDEPFEQYLKVKMSLYLITSALSAANKYGWEEMSKWTEKQSDRIYQFKVGATLDKEGKEIYPPIAAYLRIKAGNTKAGRGEYTRKRPFVLFDFPNPDGCLAVLTGRYEFVEAVTKKCVAIIGSGDSYAVQFNNIMTLCQNMLLPDPVEK